MKNIGKILKQRQEATNFEYKAILRHKGHNIECVTYGKQNVSIECIDCMEVLKSIDKKF